MPTIAELFDLENAVETAAQSILVTDGHGPVFTQRDVDDLPDERIDVQLKVGAPNGHRRPSTRVRDQWRAVLTLTIWTRRNADSAADHGLKRGALRYACECIGGRFDSDVLPYHGITFTDECSTDPQVALGDDLDCSALHFDVLVGIRPEAWPA